MGTGTFILYDIDLEALDFLTKKQVGELFIALKNNRLKGATPDFGSDKTLKVIYHQITKHIAINEEKYAQICKRNSENAKKRWQKDRNILPHTDAYESIQSDTNVCLYDTDTVTDNDNDTVTDTVTVACGAQKKTRERKNYNHYGYGKGKYSEPRLLQNEPSYDIEAFTRKAMELKYKKKSDIKPPCDS